MKKNKKQIFSGWLRAFLIVALLFLAIGLGTLGSVRTVGDSYRLPAKRSGDSLTPSIVLHLTEPGHGEEGHVHRDQLYVKAVYVNVGTVYADYGKTATLRLARATNLINSNFYNYVDLPIVNGYQSNGEGSENVPTGQNSLYNWVAFDVGEGWSFSLYPFYRLSLPTDSAIRANYDVLINEIVFVANEQDGTGEPLLLKAEIDSESILPGENALQEAAAVVDKQYIPNLCESSFFRYTLEEVPVLSTITEMKQGGVYASGNVHHMDRTYGAFGLDLVALGTSIFGLSPFGLRFVPFLASFLTLVFGYLLVKKMFSSEKAGLIFSVLYALCGISVVLGHFGSPLMIGVCFFTASLCFCYQFFRDGMKSAKLSSALPCLLSGLFAAAAICTNGAFVLPVVGIVGLFAAGVVRQGRRNRAALELAIGEAEALEAQEKTAAEEGREAQVPAKEGRKRVAEALSRGKYERNTAITLFAAFLLWGVFLIALLSALPLYSTFVKVLDNPAAPSKSVFYYILQSLLGGFSGGNGLPVPSAWSFFYVLFRGTGDMYAVTATGALVGVAALLIGLAGEICAIFRLIRIKGASKEEICLLIVGIAICLVTASFAQGGLAFLFLAYLLLFAFAPVLVSAIERKGEESGKKGGKALVWVGFAVLALCFAAFAVFTFSIPLPASVLTAVLK